MKNTLRTLSLSLALTVAAPAAMAVPVLGGQLFYTGGDITIKTLPVTSGFTTELGLYTAGRTLIAALGIFDEPAGVSITFNPGTAYGYAVGQELVFGIDIVGNSDVFVMGAASRNADGVVHNTVDNLGGGVFVVGFEDLFGGGDQDYDDNRFEFRGGIVSNDVPEPGALALLGLGLAGLGAGSRRRRA